MRAKSPTLKVGLTGGIGAGKSTIAKIFRTLGVPTYDSDVRARYLMQSDNEVINGLTALFGSDAFDNQGRINRERIGQIVFGNPPLLEKLNQLVHPAVGRDFKVWMTNHSRYPYVLKEAALLFESGSYRELDLMITVSASEQTRIRRVLKRDRHRSPSDIKRIIDRQMAQEMKEDKANFIINNDDQEMIIPQVLNLDKTIRSLSVS